MIEHGTHFEALTKVGSSPVVELAVHPGGFGPAAYLALPYALVHEAICHVPSRPLGEASNSSAFAEGFMDWAARFFFADWMAKIDPALAPAARDHAQRMDQAVTVASTTPGAERLRGRRAAERIVTWLVSEHARSRQGAEIVVAVLARDLNCIDRGFAFKDKFVADVNGAWSASFEARLAAVIEKRAPVGSLL